MLTFPGHFWERKVGYFIVFREILNFLEFSGILRKFLLPSVLGAETGIELTVNLNIFL